MGNKPTGGESGLDGRLDPDAERHSSKQSIGLVTSDVDTNLQYNAVAEPNSLQQPPAARFAEGKTHDEIARLAEAKIQLHQKLEEAREQVV
jgi:hypothetical protein